MHPGVKTAKSPKRPPQSSIPVKWSYSSHDASRPKEDSNTSMTATRNSSPSQIRSPPLPPSRASRSFRLRALHQRLRQACPSTRFTLALVSDPSKTQTLELSQTFDPQALRGSSGQRTRRLSSQESATASPATRSPDLYLTLSGLPLRFSALCTWPFHESSAGADTSVVHGQANLDRRPRLPAPRQARRLP